MITQFKQILKKVQKLDLEKQITIINEFKLMMHEIGPFKTEPVDCVFG